MSTLIWRDHQTRDPRNGHTCVIVHELGREEVDAEVGPMFRIRFEDGTERDAFADELTIPRMHETLQRTTSLGSRWPLPINDLVLQAVAKHTDRTYSTVRALASTVTPWITFAGFVRMCEQEGHR